MHQSNASPPLSAFDASCTKYACTCSNLKVYWQIQYISKVTDLTNGLYVILCVCLRVWTPTDQHHTRTLCYKHMMTFKMMCCEFLSSQFSTEHLWDVSKLFLSIHLYATAQTMKSHSNTCLLMFTVPCKTIKTFSSHFVTLQPHSLIYSSHRPTQISVSLESGVRLYSTPFFLCYLNKKMLTSL